MISERHDSYLFLKDKLDRFILSHSDWSVSSRVGFLRQRNSEGQNLEIARKLKNKNIDPEIIKVVTGITV
jgi:vacuolar-type H+-ATPase subunit C/Vma6